MQCFTFGDIGKRRINAVKLYGAKIDYALSEASNAMNGKHGGKIDAIRKPKAILLFYFIQFGNICRKGDAEARISPRLKKIELLVSFP